MRKSLLRYCVWVADCGDVEEDSIDEYVDGLRAKMLASGCRVLCSPDHERDF